MQRCTRSDAGVRHINAVYANAARTPHGIQPYFVHLSNVSFQERYYFDCENISVDSSWLTVSRQSERRMKITHIRGIKLYLL